MAKSDIKELLGTDEGGFMLDSLDSDLDTFDGEVFGELAVDVYQTAKDVVVKAPIAGVHHDDVDITVTDDMVAIKGERKEENEVDDESYHAKECYWGAFSRTISTPVPVVPEKANAKFKNGILTIRVPKASQSKLRKLKVEAE